MTHVKHSKHLLVETQKQVYIPLTKVVGLGKTRLGALTEVLGHL